MLDEKDRAIISCLQYDGRTPYTKIANELSITEGSVRRRVKRLVDEGQLMHLFAAELDRLVVSICPRLVATTIY